MTKPLSNFLKAPAQNNDYGSLSVVTPESEVCTASSSVVHVETEQIAADTAVLAAEPMMTAPFEMKSVSADPVVLKPEAGRAVPSEPADQAAGKVHAASAVQAAETIEAKHKMSASAASSEVPQLVATARVAAAKSLATGFKPAVNVKPSVFIKQQQFTEKAVSAHQNPLPELAAEPEEQVAPAVMQVQVIEPVKPQAVERPSETTEKIEIQTGASAQEIEEAGASVLVAGEVLESKMAENTAAPEPSPVQTAEAVLEQAAGRHESLVPLSATVSPERPAQVKTPVWKSAVKPIQVALSALPALPVAGVGRFWQNKPVRWSILGVLLPVSGMVAAYAVNEPPPEKELFRAERVVEELPPVYVESGIVNGSYWAQEAVQPGDSLTDVLHRIGVSEENIRQVLVHSAIDRDLIQLRAGQSVNVRFDASGDATDVQFFNDDDNGFRDLVAIEKVNGKWGASTSAIDMETMPTLRSVLIRTSARGALAQAGVPVEIRESLSEIFNDVVKVEELGEGDSIRLLYNSMYFRGQEMATGDILAAEVVKGGKTYQAYYYSQGKGDEESGSYYDQHGKALHLTDGFNVKPVEYTRISSPYGMRVHPVLHTVKMHTGIDYAAATGTPIRATADGTLTFKGWKGGYGNTVVLMHSNGIETLYAHMSAFSPAQGKVKAGEVIGYVGSTGRSTGPHLHYEVRKNGQPMNPTAIALPTPKLTPANMAEFRKQQNAHSATLAAVRHLPVSVTQLD